jgi:hypothetical protein
MHDVALSGGLGVPSSNLGAPTNRMNELVDIAYVLASQK